MPDLQRMEKGTICRIPANLLRRNTWTSTKTLTGTRSTEKRGLRWSWDRDPTRWDHSSQEKDVEDKALFVAWLGELLSMTREGISRCYLADNDTVIVRWKDGAWKRINIAMNSRMAIIRQVVNDEDLR